MSFNSHTSLVKEAQFRAESLSARADAMADAYEAAIEKLALGLPPGAAAILPHTVNSPARTAAESARTLMGRGQVHSRAHFKAPAFRESHQMPHSGAGEAFGLGQFDLRNKNRVSIGRGAGDNVHWYPAKNV